MEVTSVPSSDVRKKNQGQWSKINILNERINAPNFFLNFHNASGYKTLRNTITLYANFVCTLTSNLSLCASNVFYFYWVAKLILITLSLIFLSFSFLVRLFKTQYIFFIWNGTEWNWMSVLFFDRMK